MNNIVKGIEIGDRITFKAVTRNSHRKATRAVNGAYPFYFPQDGPFLPTVRYEGWSDFVVKESEIIEVHKKEEVTS